MISVDWGSSSVRAFRLDRAGNILAQRRTSRGILTARSNFESVLGEHLVGWDDSLVVLSGMIGSRQGWVEVPYVACPATHAEIAAGMFEIGTAGLPGRQVWIVPGLKADGIATDVMRGEETQLCGLLSKLDQRRHMVVMPGTHSKWAVVQNGRIQSFSTAMTGETYHLLRHHGLLASLMAGGNELDVAAFVQGVQRARDPGGLLQHLFSVRAAGVLGTLRSDQLPSYLSGILIGHELADSGQMEALRHVGVHLVGAQALVSAYRVAFREFDVATEGHGETLAADGAYTLARCRGWIDAAAQ